MHTPTRLMVAGIAAPVVALATTAGAFILTGGHRRLGATAGEASAPLPGDDLLPDANRQNDRAITIAAPPAAVWPWIAQLGQDKAGFYSFEAIENALGCDVRGATRVVERWQHPAVGDPFPLHPDISLRVGVVEPGRSLAATSEGGSAAEDMGMDFSWAFVLTGQPGPEGPSTRLHIRERYRLRDARVRATAGLVSIGSAVMTARMMHRIRSLAERG